MKVLPEAGRDVAIATRMSPFRLPVEGTSRMIYRPEHLQIPWSWNFAAKTTAERLMK
jgi:hypothetical protein